MQRALIQIAAPLSADWAGDATSDVRKVLERIGGEVVHPERYRWWHALAFGVGINAFSRLLTGDERLYSAFKQAPFAPPAWVFGPAWGINNASVLAGNLRLLNLPSSPTRRRLLLLQAVSWLIFATFSLVYFRLRSPILAFVWTAGMYLLTIGSIWLAARLDTKVAWSFATLVAWLSLATLVAGYQVIYNRDPLFDTPALR